MSNFSSKEISENIAQIRKMYATYSSQYKDMNIFDVELFNGRYLKALQEKIDITTFIKAEISVLEDLRERAEILKKEKEKKMLVNEETFMTKVDAMLEKFSDAISKYPAISIHDDSNNEIDRLYGAFTELNACFRVARGILNDIKDYNIETILKDIDLKIQNFAISNFVGQPPHIFADYYDDLNSGRDVARSEQYILKESGFFLHSFAHKFDDVINFVNRIPIDAAVVIPKDIQTDTPRVYKSFSKKTQHEVFMATKLYAEAMINDFRLQHFKNNEI